MNRYVNPANAALLTPVTNFDHTGELSDTDVLKFRKTHIQLVNINAATAHGRNPIHRRNDKKLLFM
ncbi:MAG TPA: hypothetical protein PKA44_08375 [Saprospiraceae bacterium]|mgnify:CR=1 FL=1|jgi:hypothetical protein|nr:hypothetical protein [Saprospiraceae bacterium]